MAKRLVKPAAIRSDPWRSRKWDELVRGRGFAPSDAPALTLLVQWYQVVERCMEDISTDGGVQVAYSNDVGDIRALPQLATMKQASAEIRQLNKQLGIRDEARPRAEAGKASVLRLVTEDRRRKEAGGGAR